jgi:DNA-binding MarR family transcriptional regulator
MNNATTSSKQEPFTPVSSLSSSYLPELDKNLISLYGVLDDSTKSLFNKVYKYLWTFVNGRKMDLINSYWCVDMLRTRLDLTPSQLAMLTYLYQVTNKGKRYIHNDLIYAAPILPHLLRSPASTSMQVLLYYLKEKGYIIRSRYDPVNRCYKWGRNRRPVFLNLSASGVKLIEDLNKDISRILLNTSLNDITGANKRA